MNTHSKDQNGPALDNPDSLPHSPLASGTGPAKVDEPLPPSPLAPKSGRSDNPVLPSPLAARSKNADNPILPSPLSPSTKKT